MFPTRKSEKRGRDDVFAQKKEPSELLFPLGEAGVYVLRAMSFNLIFLLVFTLMYFTAKSMMGLVLRAETGKKTVHGRVKLGHFNSKFFFYKNKPHV